jgi:superfamily II DNA/RNA helicase
LDVFELRRKLVEEYGQYATSFVHIADDRIRQCVDEDLSGGLLWPEPLIQLNPAFESGGFVDELVAQGLLHPECGRIFRAKSVGPAGQVEDKGPLRLHRHQRDAIEAANADANYVLTTGTGSGKSLTYLIPIVDRVLRSGSGQGIKAIIVYPMNALANSQVGELDKYINLGYPDRKGPVTFKRYTGQESDEERLAIIANPPDILITNYVMMELILTRPFEKKLIAAAKDLRFLVFDELHTYRGRQGADVAMLARRIRDACGAGPIQHIGTSATMASTVGTLEEQRAEVAEVASELFGARVHVEHVIGETLRRVTSAVDTHDPLFVGSLRDRVASETPPPKDFDAFVADPLSAWIEDAIGLTTESASARLVRRRPRAIRGTDGAASELAAVTGIPTDRAVDAIEAQLLAGYRITEPETGFRALAFRLHQFISRGETAYATIERPADRHLTTEPQRFVPGGRSRILFPLTFCRECGQEYYPITLVGPEGARAVTERDYFAIQSESGAEPGFIYVDDPEHPWPMATEEVVTRLPDDWLEAHDDAPRLKKDVGARLPRSIRLTADGREADEGLDVWFVPAPFRFCLRCGVAYTARQRSDYSKLATLGSGGRSTATTILSLSVVRGLRADDTLEDKARKLLSFTDNRQDASLQAGHFNDFVQTSLLRSALYTAANEAGATGIAHDTLTQRVFDALALPPELYASDPEVKYAAKQETDRALRNVIGYRLYRDLMRGWRITSPNLEQCGLLHIDYQSLEELCSEDAEWQGKHPALADAVPATRATIAKVLLDHMRRELAIKVDYLDERYQEQLQQQSSIQLRQPWAIDDGERLETATILFPRGRRPADFRGYTYLSGLSGFGQYLRRPGVLPHLPQRPSAKETGDVIAELLATLRIAGLVERVKNPGDGEDVPGYQIPASAMIWRAGDGTAGFRDPIRVPRAPDEGRRTNDFFVRFYRTIAEDAKGLIAHEHTAQVPADVREEREADFREAKLPVLFCSPTMELGVDIAELNAVNLRNVPPTPANYAQRSGRAGRSGQPALVFTYCTTGSPHDQYYFRRQQDVVSGQVAPPKIDLGNEDLIRAHVQAVWLAEIDAFLGSSLRDVLDIEGDDPTLALLPDLQAKAQNANARERALARADSLVRSIGPDLLQAPWYDDGWLKRTIDGAAHELDAACDRWRTLYRAARDQREKQNKIIGDASKSHKDKNEAKRLRREAESQLELLTAEGNTSSIQSDFYSYRYFASEGFLPGYSFPRLPLSAYIPGGRRVRQDGDFVSRPRFLAISEFGPRSFIYHEGSRFIINRVLMPPDASADDGDGVPTRSAKWCQTCGYLHPMSNPPGPDLCERCRAPLDVPITNLLRLQNVATKRRDRISSDEEERMRQGYDIRTGIRFTQRHGRPDYRTARVVLEDEPFATLTFGDSSEIWRVNLGWRRQTKAGHRGFVLDVQNGYWARNEANELDPEDPMSPNRATVIPFVDDRKNALLLEFEDAPDRGTMASLQAALKRAIGAVFELEDNELAAEPLPTPEDRRTLLFYEAAEGGAGVLRRLVDDPGQLARVAAAALEICHYDTATGQDLGHAPSARFECEAACYDCLMSYANQPDHDKLDRKQVRKLLDDLRRARVEASPVPKSREEHYAELKNLTDSQLERSWLEFVFEHDLALPTSGQKLIADCRARPDFYYDAHSAAIFIDGPAHDEVTEAKLDDQKRTCLEDLGYTVIRFRHDDDWPAIAGRYPSIFGAAT